MQINGEIVIAEIRVGFPSVGSEEIDEFDLRIFFDDSLKNFLDLDYRVPFHEINLDHNKKSRAREWTQGVPRTAIETDWIPDRVRNDDGETIQSRFSGVSQHPTLRGNGFRIGPAPLCRKTGSGMTTEGKVNVGAWVTVRRKKGMKEKLDAGPCLPAGRSSPA
jgi:hypothetical protein